MCRLYGLVPERILLVRAGSALARFAQCSPRAVSRCRSLQVDPRYPYAYAVRLALHSAYFLFFHPGLVDCRRFRSLSHCPLLSLNASLALRLHILPLPRQSQQNVAFVLVVSSSCFPSLAASPLRSLHVILVPYFSAHVVFTTDFPLNCFVNLLMMNLGLLSHSLPFF